jgi:hypothetical protein
VLVQREFHSSATASALAAVYRSAGHAIDEPVTKGRNGPKTNQQQAGGRGRPPARPAHRAAQTRLAQGNRPASARTRRLFKKGLQNVF